MLHVVSWLWGRKWGPEYPERMFAGVRRNLRRPHRALLITDRYFGLPGVDAARIHEDDVHLLALPGCLARMRLLSLEWQRDYGIRGGDQILCLDVDTVITGSLDLLLARDDDLTIMQGFNTTNPCPFNGSMWMLRAGVRPDAWSDFNLEAVAGVPYHHIPDDQAWLHHKFPNAGAWTTRDGVYAFKKVGWGGSGRRGLPRGARVVAFPGRDPGKYVEQEWIKEHWLCR